MEALNSSVLFVGLYCLPVLLVVATGAQMVRLYVGNIIARRPDPHLGRKLALHTLASAAIGLLLVAASVTISHTVEVVFPKPANPAPAWWNDSQRTMAGLAVSGLFYLLLFEAVLRFGTNDRAWPRVRRAAAGVRFAGCAGVCMALTTASNCVMFQADPPEATLVAAGLGLAGLWFPVAVFHFWLMTGRDLPADDGSVEATPA